ncbi:MAG: cytosine permease [Firmicutes bacterium]|nr:cytosine permease [Bacillota bacterium]
MESKYTQIEFSEGLFVMDEEVKKSLAGSRYINEDLRPTTQAERTWNTYNVSMLWIGMVICITGFSYAAALIALGMSPILALINVAIGNLIVLIPMQLNSHAGTRYGIPFPIFVKLSFGRSGGHLPSLMRTIVAGGWCAIQCWVGGAAFSAIIGVFSSSWEVDGFGRYVGFALFLIVTLILGIRGSEGIKWIENLGSPVLIALCIALIVWIISLGNSVDVSVGDMFLAGNDTALLDQNGGLAMVFMAGITSNIAVWATLALNIPDFSRYAKSQSAQFRGQMFAMPISVMILATIGAMFAKVTQVAYGEAQYDPTAVLLHLNSKVLVVIVSLATILGTLTTNMAANVVAPANGFASLAPKKISYKMGVIFTCVLCIIYRPWWIFGSAGAFMFTFLGTCGTILGPVAAILVADYFIVKKKRVDIKALYDEGNDRYDYTNGWNIKAVASWILGAGIPMLGKFIGGSFMGFIDANSYIIGFLISFILYIVLMKSEKKSYVSEEEFNAITKKEY